MKKAELKVNAEHLKEHKKKAFTDRKKMKSERGKRNRYFILK